MWLERLRKQKLLNQKFMKLLKLAAIDIGSNAVRLLVNDIIDNHEKPYFQKASLVRLPVRLGADVFEDGKISDTNIKRLTDTIEAYRLLMQIHGVTEYRAFATSAMREAENGKKVAQHIKAKTGIEIQIIDGMLEAELLFATRITKQLDTSKSYLYVDVGGGSTECTLFADGKSRASQSFKIGTIRLLNNQVSDKKWTRLKDWLSDIKPSKKPLTIIGTGGNVNKISKIINGKKQPFISNRQLRDLYKELSTLNMEQRMRRYSMRPDRADVIVPAARIFTTVMAVTDAKELFVPKVGLSDGMIRWMYANNND